MRPTPCKLVLRVLLAVSRRSRRPPQPPPPERTAGGEPKLQRALDQILTAGAPGAIVLVRNCDRTPRLTSGYGDLARKTPMRATEYRNRAPCGGSPFWGHGGGAPGYAIEALMRQDGRREFVLLVNTSESLSARAQEAHFRALTLAYCGSER